MGGGQNFVCTYLIKARTIWSRVEKVQVIVILQNSSYKTVIKCLYLCQRTKCVKITHIVGQSRSSLSHNINLKCLLQALWQSYLTSSPIMVKPSFILYQ